MSDVVLLQFPYSHYNEKARWALDWKGVAHRRENLLPGPHAGRIKRLTGQTTVPVLRIGSERVIAGSAAIIDELERLQPEPALYPRDPELRRRALELASHFDENVGPHVRRALFSVLIHEPGYFCRIFSTGQRLPMRLFYRGLFPVARGMVVKSMQLDDPAAVAQSLAATEAALDRVAKEVGPSGQLAGDGFGVADPTAAALLAPLFDPDHPDMARPQPQPEPVRAFLARWQSHPGLRWAQEQYRRHRPRRTA